MQHFGEDDKRGEDKAQREQRIREFDEARRDQRRLAIDGVFHPCCQTTIHYHDSIKGGEGDDDKKGSTPRPLSITFSKGNMLTYARELATNAPAGTVAVLNMANAAIPGGGYMRNCAAQEEQLCRTTSLYPALDHAAKGGAYPIKPGKALCTWDVKVVRDENDLKQRLSFPFPQYHVVSVAAKRYRHEDEANADKKLVSCLRATWIAAIKAADECGAHEFVVSALGCGAFRNPPERVAQAFCLALEDCELPRGSLKKISVVVMDDHNSRDNVLRFKQELDDWDVLKADDGGSPCKRQRVDDEEGPL